MIHAMIDLETLATTPDAIILTCGGVKFDPWSTEEPSQPFYLRLDVDEQTNIGRRLNEDTLKWWESQPAEVKEEALSDGNRVSLGVFKDSLNKFLVGVDYLWAQGPLFDYAILENLYTQLEQPYAWQFWQIRDSRTLFSLCPGVKDKVKRTDMHNALADCYFQAKAVQYCYKELKVPKQ